MRELADLFKALSDETRVRIVALLLLRRELCVCDVEGVLGITQSKASRHLRALRAAGLVEDRRDGPWVHYALPRSPGPARAGLVKTLRRLLPETDRDELATRLDAWFEAKAAGGACRVA